MSATREAQPCPHPDSCDPGAAVCGACLACGDCFGWIDPLVGAFRNERGQDACKACRKLDVPRIKVKIVDIVITPREVEIPIECPACGADLTETDAVQTVEFEPQTYTGQFDADGDWDYGDVGGSSCDAGGFGFTAISCAECRHEIAVGTETTAPEALSKEALDAILTN